MVFKERGHAQRHVQQSFKYGECNSTGGHYFAKRVVVVNVEEPECPLCEEEFSSLAEDYERILGGDCFGKRIP